ncbi:MAG: hypothetical protein PF551_07620 [Candidatus Marinimicrobia bacterium]|jgi:hypothetical protein|nr:hypothetical protein [Candidatus Neomarinimicrobiota bacterium]
MKSIIAVNFFSKFILMSILILLVNNSFAQDAFEKYKKAQNDQF